MIHFTAEQQAAIQAAAQQQAAEILIQQQVNELLAASGSSLPTPAPPPAISAAGFDYSGSRTISPVPSPITENPANAAPLTPQGGHDSAPPPPPLSVPVLSPPAVGAGVSAPTPAAVGFDQQDSLAATELLARDYFSPHMAADLPAPGTLNIDNTPLGSPVVVSDRTLAAALELLEPQEAWAPSTASEYHGLIRRWQEYHDSSPGPAVSNITEEMILAFLNSVAAWATHRTRNKQLTYLTKILQAVAPKTGRTKYGMRVGRAWLSEVPYVRLPKKARPTTTQTWRLDNVTVDDLARMYCVAGMIPDALRWQTLLVLVWLYGPRRADLLLMPWEAIDWNAQTLSYIETKGGHPVGPLPLPDYVLEHLRACRKQDWRGSILGFARNDIRKGTNNIYPTLYRIYEQAEVTVPLDKASRRIPLHGLRAACITNWKGHAPGLQRFVTGHQHGSDVSDENYARIGGQMREHIETLPVPAEFGTGPGATKRVRRRRGSNPLRRSSRTVIGTGDSAPGRADAV